MLQLVHGDVLDTEADALLLTIDGQAKGLRGNVAHAFIRRWPDDYDDFESQLRFPIALGSAIRTDAETDSPWSTIIFVATLHHLETLDTTGKLDVIRRSFTSALNLAARTGIRAVATVPLTGGWRLSAVDAYRMMLTTYDSSELVRSGGTLRVCCRDHEEYASFVHEHRQLRLG